jgi:hypothetical protein
VSFYRVSYCDRAKELGLPKLYASSRPTQLPTADASRDSHSPNGDETGDASGDPSGASSSQPPASSANNNNFSQSNNQQDNHNMSTIAHSGAGTTFSNNASIATQRASIPQYGAHVPRSALQEDGKFNTEDMSCATSLLDTQGRGSVNIDTALNDRSTMEVTHDGKVTVLVARFESYSNHVLSNASQVPHDDHARATSMSITCGSVSDVGTNRGQPSPRKPIPSQWLPLSNAPKLATAQRAKERGHKQGSLSGSPVEAKALRGTRSMVDMSRGQSNQEMSFPTKMSHAAMESVLPSPTGGRSPTKQQRPSAKPAWNSPNGSPQRESPKQQAHLLMRTSPHKTSFLTADTGSRGHRRGTSSVATSATGGSVYHSADSSPVGDSTALALSFTSAAEVLDDDGNHFPHLHRDADFENEQTPNHVQTSTNSATVGRASKPSLKIEIPPTDARHDMADRSSTSAASNSPWSTTSASPASRIPRAAATSATSSARGPTRSSTLKRTQSTKSLTSPRTKVSVQGQGSSRQADTPPTPPSRHVRTVDSSGTTPIMSKCHTPRREPSSESIPTVVKTDLSSAQHTQATVEHVASLLGSTKLHAQQELYARAEGSRASSMSTVKATTTATDPVIVDPAIIYSKKSGAYGTTLDQTLNVPPIVLMMAHNFDIGTFHPDDDKNRAASNASTSTHSSAQNAAPARGRAEHYEPTARRQAESEHSLQSSLASDLRATAPEFVPYPSVTTPKIAQPAPAPQLDPTTDLLGDMKYELDAYGTPWYYYMYQVQFAYDQGFQQGKSRSPKKVRQKKQHPSSSADSHAQKPNSKATNNEGGNGEQRTTAMLPPTSTLPLAEQRAQQQRENNTETNDRPISPFAAQKALIDRHIPYPNARVTEVPISGIDITTIRNVGLPSTRRRTHRSDNGLYSYRGRGVPGLRMADTIPFPPPVAPQGRPVQSAGEEACGRIDIVYAMERVGGEACLECEVDCHE